MRDLNDMIPAFQLPHLISSFRILEWKNRSFPQLSRSTSITIMRQSSLFLKNGSKICPRIPTFPSFVSHKRLEIIGFPAFPGTISQAFPAFLYLSKTFLAFPEIPSLSIPSLSIPSYPIFFSSTYKTFNMFKDIKVGKLGIPENSHLTQLFPSLSCKGGCVKRNYDRHSIHQHQCMIDPKGKHSFIHSLTGGNIHLIISMDHSVSIVTALPSISVKTKTYQFYH